MERIISRPSYLSSCHRGGSRVDGTVREGVAPHTSHSPPLSQSIFIYQQWLQCQVRGSAGSKHAHRQPIDVASSLQGFYRTATCTSEMMAESRDRRFGSHPSTTPRHCPLVLNDPTKSYLSRQGIPAPSLPEEVLLPQRRQNRGCIRGVARPQRLVTTHKSLRATI